MNLVQHDQAAKAPELKARVGQPREINRILKVVPLDRIGMTGDQLPGKGGLANLAGPDERDDGELAQQKANASQVCIARRGRIKGCVKAETAYLVGSVTSLTRAGEETPGKARRLMREATQGSRWKSSDLWEALEQMVRGRIQEFIQEILEDEVTEFLGGRAKSQRRATVEGGRRGYRNGYGKPRNLTLASGTVQVCRPRVRDVEERFESRVLPLFARRTKEAAELVVQLYLHGLAEGDFELALRGLLGDGAPLSKSTVRRLRERWVAEHAEWERRSLAGRELVYAWADGIYVKAGLEKDKAVLLVVIGAMADGTKEVLAVVPGFRESAESWAAVLRSLKARGLGVPKLLVADGNLGIWAAARQVWPEAGEQRCWNHKMANVLDRLPKREQAEAKRRLREVVYAESRAGAGKARDAFADLYADAYPKAVEILAGDWGRMTAFFDFPAGHWRHLRTTNVVESPFAAVRLRTSAAKRFRKVDGATALIWKLLMVAEKRFRKLNSPHLLPGVLAGRRYADGKPVPAEERPAA